MALGQAYKESVQDSKYIPSFKDPEGEEGSRFNQDKQAFNKLAFHGKAGNLSSRPKPGQSGNTPKLETASRFQKARSRKK